MCFLFRVLLLHSPLSSHTLSPNNLSFITSLLILFFFPPFFSLPSQWFDSSRQVSVSFCLSVCYYPLWRSRTYIDKAQIQFGVFGRTKKNKVGGVCFLRVCAPLLSEPSLHTPYIHKKQRQAEVNHHHNGSELMHGVTLSSLHLSSRQTSSTSPTVSTEVVAKGKKPNRHYCRFLSLLFGLLFRSSFFRLVLLRPPLFLGYRFFSPSFPVLVVQSTSLFITRR